MSGLAARLALAAALALPAAAASAAGPPSKVSDWPCMQRLVPELSASSLWTGVALPEPGAWRADTGVVGLVEAVTPRSVTAEAGEAQIVAYLATTPSDQRAQKAAAAFAGLLEVTNTERADLIGRIKALGRRQREVADLVAQVSEELHGIPDAASGADADRRDEVMQRRGYLIRQFEDTQRTMRFACEAPTQLEARLGRYARVLQGQN